MLASTRLALGYLHRLNASYAVKESSRPALGQATALFVILENTRQV
jgi:hypothetical protein